MTDEQKNCPYCHVGKGSVKVHLQYPGFSGNRKFASKMLYESFAEQESIGILPPANLVGTRFNPASGISIPESMVAVNFCPMCGRDLRGNPSE
ncbi:hypothetical protein GPK34_00205 [Secundilactobacillus kimchicus]|nr:hypothetical protein [Secundilactobacillus kimchicus]